MRALRAVTQRTRAFVGRFLQSTNANVAMIFGLVIVVMVMICGAGIDVARAVSMRSRLGSALDAAGIAVGAELNRTQAELEQLAQDYFNANYPDGALGTPNSVVVTSLGDSSYALSVSGSVETVFLRVVNINKFDVAVRNQVTRSANNIEVGLVLDITGSMCSPCTKIADLKVAAKDMVDLIVQDVQTPYYTKLGIAPYSSMVNVGNAYANSVRGAITPGRAINAVAWQTGLNKNITAVNKASPGVVTSLAHGFVTGDKVWISGVVGMTQLNNKPYKVGVTALNTFQLKDINNVNVSTLAYSNYTSGGIIRKCVSPTVGTSCQVQVTTTGAHGFANNDWVVMKGVGGMINVNNGNDNSAWQVSEAAATTFMLKGTMPSGTNPAYPAYTAGGTAYCTVYGCEYQRFTSQTGVIRVFQVSTCVTDRGGANAFSDAGPSTTLLGKGYPAAPKPPATDLNPCPSAAIMPLSVNKPALKAQIDAMVTSGSTAGHLGAAWGWYLVSPNFAYLFPAASQPAPYGTPHLFKVVILMTDGEFNTMACDGVISQDSPHISGYSNKADHKNCNSPNGGSFTQAQNLCDGMKEAGIIVYTVGFDIGSDANAQAIIANCATSAGHAYYPNTGAELKTTFHKISQEISELRLAQ